MPQTTTTLLNALEATVQYLLDSTDCTTVGEVIKLICETFGDEHAQDELLYKALDKFCSIGHLEP